MDVAITRHDLVSTHEEADVILPQQLINATSQGAKNVALVCDDTDVFVLLLYFYLQKQLSCFCFMEATSTVRATIDIAATVQRHSAIIPQLLAAHALSGCDTVAKLSALGKSTVVKKLQQGHKLYKLGNKNADIQDVVSEATQFIAACYGRKDSDITMSDIRYDVWLTKTGNKNVRKTPKLQSLPPTTESFFENVKRAHIQTCIWKSAMDAQPPDLDPTNFGWTKDERNKVLVPSENYIRKATSTCIRTSNDLLWLCVRKALCNS